ncbi:MAG: hypothetical protein LBU73_06410 [Helicobacteraceae bacterium]|nr:hypothetical protein [Helicobacteraceae bacterium]
MSAALKNYENDQTALAATYFKRGNLYPQTRDFERAAADFERLINLNRRGENAKIALEFAKREENLSEENSLKLAKLRQFTATISNVLY